MVSSPWTEEWVAFAKTMGPTPVLPEDLKLQKAAANQIFTAMATLQPPPPETIISSQPSQGLLHSTGVLETTDTQAEDMQIPDGPMVRVYRPDTTKKELLPMVIFCHAGGWVAGSLDTEDRGCRIISSMMQSWVVSVDYRCGIEFTLEEEVDDCYRAFEWARGRASAHGADPDKMVVWGGSAGGSLAQAVVYRLVQEGKGSHVAGLALMCPVVLHPDAIPEKYKHLSTSYTENAGPLPFISARDAYSIYERRDLAPPNTHITLFPVAGGPDAVRGFPPTYAVSSDNDATRDDCTVLAAVLKDAGVPVKHENIMGLAHYFWIFNLPNANQDFWSRMAKGILWTLMQTAERKQRSRL